jgi:type VI secretion system protein ImpA
MSAGWNGQALLQPVTDDQPCGENLEDTPSLASLEALRLFGQSRSPDAPPEPDESRKPVEWGEIRAGALEALARSHDLRLLTYLGTALLRTDGLPAFFETLTIASRWLESYWDQVYPLIDEDAMARRNALNCFADPMAVIDRLRRTPLVDSRQHGRFSLRDIDIATGQTPPGATDVKPEEGQIDAAFLEMPIEQLAGLQQGAAGAKAALDSMEARMRREGGTEVAPSFDHLSAQLVKLNRVLLAQLALRPSTQTADSSEPAEAAGSGAVAVAGVWGVKSHLDAVRALDAVTEFFRRNEPSSPVPLFLERAKRLVAKDFFEVLADIAPEALDAARAAGGLKRVS